MKPENENDQQKHDMSRDEKKEIKAQEQKIKELEEQIETLSKEKDDIFAQLQRVSADYANFQKRAPKQIADSVVYEKKAIIKSLLPSLDNFEHALEGAKKAESVDSVLEGVKLVFDHMLDALKGHGVERIESVGDEFDPNVHEALMRRSEEDKPDNVVLEAFQPGYTINGQVLRPAKVIVNKLPEAPKEEHKIDEEQVEEAQSKEQQEGQARKIEINADKKKENEQ